jgi:hypothetical protein
MSNRDTEKKDVEKNDVIIIDGVEYVRKNKKQLIEEPVIIEPGLERIDE